MRPVEFTTDDIIAAGKKLAASGKNVTGFALRNAVGGGNAPRLKAVWDAHVAAQIEEDAPAPDLPSHLSEHVDGLITGLGERIQAMAANLYADALRHAHGTIAEDMAKSQAKREAADAELSEASDQLDRLEDTNQELASRLADLEEALARATLERNEAREHAAHLHGQLIALQKPKTTPPAKKAPAVAKVAK